MNILNKLGQSIVEKPFFYKTVQFPISHVDEGTFEDQTGLTFKMKRHVAGWFYNIRSASGKRIYTYAQLTTLFDSKLWNELAKAINQIIATSNIVAYDVKHNRETYFNACWRDGFLMGVMYDYTPVMHMDLLTQIRNAGLTDNVKFGWINETQLTLFLNNSSADDEHMYVRIDNGHNGIRALDASYTFRYGTYENIFEDKKHAYARHQSNLMQAIEGIQEMIENLSDYQFDKYLKELSEYLVTAKLDGIAVDDNLFTERQQNRAAEILGLVQATHPINGLAVVCELARQYDVRGFGTVAKILLDELLKILKDEFVKSTI